jgi:beta-lactamase regulating signal transducer with metallopeptidase domain
VFVLRGVVVCFSVFFLIYIAASLGVLLLWRFQRHFSRRRSSGRRANLLFLLRIFPLLFAVGITLVLAVPSFWLLEPRSVEESVGVPTLLLSLGAVAAISLGLINAMVVLLRTSRTISTWLGDGSSRAMNAFDSTQSVPVIRTSALAPPLTAAGILHPQVWLSSTAEFLLTERELRTALRHELAHVERRDNLRKLILRILAFPGMAELETAWRELAELAADDAAVTTASEALDLAAAIIKLSRIAPYVPDTELTTALVHSSTQALNLRVERLIAWSDAPPSSAHPYSLARHLVVWIAVLIPLCALYPDLLAWAHAATEWLIR